MKLSRGNLQTFFLDLFFPVECLICHQNQKFPQNYLCQECLAKVKLKIEPECAFCSARSVNGQTCPFCRVENHYLDFLWAAADYQESIVKKALWAFKYKFIADLKIPLGSLLTAYLRQKKIDEFLENYRQQILLVPTPLHARRLNWRSYNQSELLAQEVAREFNLKMEKDILLRPKHRPPQAELEDKEERVKNAQNIFICANREKIKDKTVILIDDISTTGSTLDEGARILKEAGVEKVIGLVVAKG